MRHYRDQDLGEAITSRSRIAIETELDRGAIEERLGKLSSVISVLLAQSNEIICQAIADDVADFIYDESEEN